MITPNAKCVVNGPKVNEVIGSLNPLLQMTCVVGEVAEPTVQYSDTSVQIVIPPSGGVEFNQLLDIVGADNTVQSKFFATGDSPDSGGGGGGSSQSVGIGTSAGKSGGASDSQSQRDSLSGAGSSSQRDSIGNSPAPNSDSSSSGPKPNSDSGGGSQSDKKLDSYMSNLVDNIAQTSSQLRKAKSEDKQKWNQEKQMWEHKKFGDPASDKVKTLQGRLKSFKQQYEKAKSNRNNA